MSQKEEPKLKGDVKPDEESVNPADKIARTQPGFLVVTARPATEAVGPGVAEPVASSGAEIKPVPVRVKNTTDARQRVVVLTAGGSITDTIPGHPSSLATDFLRDLRRVLEERRKEEASAEAQTCEPAVDLAGALPAGPLDTVERMVAVAFGDTIPATEALQSAVVERADVSGGVVELLSIPEDVANALERALAETVEGATPEIPRLGLEIDSPDAASSEAAAQELAEVIDSGWPDPEVWATPSAQSWNTLQADAPVLSSEQQPADAAGPSTPGVITTMHRSTTLPPATGAAPHDERAEPAAEEDEVHLVLRIPLDEIQSDAGRALEAVNDGLAAILKRVRDYFGTDVSTAKVQGLQSAVSTSSLNISLFGMSANLRWSREEINRRKSIEAIAIEIEGAGHAISQGRRAKRVVFKQQYSNVEQSESARGEGFLVDIMGENVDSGRGALQLIMKIDALDLARAKNDRTVLGRIETAYAFLRSLESAIIGARPART